jgi:CubicO group peptidase (beta-lactamase class C family)
MNEPGESPAMQFHDLRTASKDISHDLGTLPAGETGARMTALLAAINSNSRTAAMDFLIANVALAPSTPVKLFDYAQWILWFYRITQGVVLRAVEPPDSPTSRLTLTVEDRLYSARYRIHVHFEQDGLGPIVEIDIEPADTPDSVAITRADYLGLAQQLCARSAAADVFSGAVLIAQGDEVLFEYACGEANKRYRVLNNIETKFNLGSANKMFTAVAVAKLVEQGHLSYTNTIDRYVDETWLPVSVARGITVHHLLSHTSGLGSFFTDTFVNGSRARFREIDDFKPLVRDDRPAFAPGERFEYSNTGMLLAGVVIESVTGVSYYDHIRSTIYASSGMLRTDCYDIDAPIDNLAMGYIPVAGNEVTPSAHVSNLRWRENIFEHVARGGPAGGGYSTVRDLHRFSQTLLSAKLVSSTMRKILWTDHAGARYGYGFEVDHTPRRTNIGHGGGFAGISASFTMHLASGLVVIVLSNYDGGAFGLARCLNEMLDRVEE